MSFRGPGGDKRRGLPWLSLALVGGAVVASVVPGAGPLLEYDRSRVATGEAWGLLTCQLVNWSARLAVLDLGAVLLLGVWIESRSRVLLARTCLATSLAVGAGVHFLAPQITTYRGASGLASALFVLVGLLAWNDRSLPRQRALAGAAIVLFLMKVGWEAASGDAIFAGPLPAGVAVLPLAHLLGGGTALLIFVREITRGKMPRQYQNGHRGDPRWSYRRTKPYRLR